MPAAPATASSRPVKLGRKMIEGAAISKRGAKIAFAVGHEQEQSIPEGQRRIVVAELDPSAATPALSAERVVFTTDGPLCHPEAQDFFDDDRKLSYTCYEPEGRASAWTLDLASGERANQSAAIGFYNEVEGIFPAGRDTCVESDHQSRPFGDPPSLYCAASRALMSANPLSFSRPSGRTVSPLSL